MLISATNPVRIELLGECSVHFNGRRTDRFPTQKTASLLAFLAVHAPRAISREAVSAAIWPGVSTVSARNSLNQAISSLRRLLSESDSSEGEIFVSGRQTIALNVEWVVTDIAEFVGLMNQAKSVKSKPERTVLLAQAAELYRGDLAPSLTELWIAPFRLQLRQANEFARRYLVKAYSRTGEPELAIPHVLQLLHRSPFSADFHTVLMELYLRAGQASAAEAHFNEARDLFEKAGESIPEGMAAFSAKASREARRAQGGLIAREKRREPREDSRVQSVGASIPRSWDSFVGRDEEIREIEKLFDDHKAVVGLIGIGGIGKTRLAIQLAQRTKPRFPGGMHYLSLSGLAFSESIASRLLQTMGVQSPMSDESPVAVMARWIDPAAETLLILDEIEHLAAEGVREVVDILESAPSLRLVYTSRRPIGLPGEIRLPIDGLDSPAAHSVWQEGVAVSTAVELFVARARSVCPEFVLSDRNYDSVARLCSSLEGIPLAIELAASWSKVLGPEQIWDEIQRSIDFLRESSSLASSRNRSLRSALTSSLQLLSSSQWQLLTRLSTLAGPWTLALAKQLSPGEDISEDLRELTSFAIVVVLRADEKVTYRLPDIIRTVVREGLDPDLEDRCLTYQAEYFREVLKGSPSDLSWVRVVEENYVAITSLMDQLRTRNKLAPLRSMILSLGEYWRTRGPLGEGLRWLQWLLDSETSHAERSIAQIHFARLLYRQGKYELASAVCSSAMKSIDKHADSKHYFMGLAFQATLHHESGDVAKTTELAEFMYREAMELGLLTQASTALLILGNQAVDACEFDLGFSRYSEALALADEGGSVSQRQYILESLGNLARRQGRIDAAVALLEETLSIRLGAGWTISATVSLSGLANCMTAANRPAEAIQFIREAIDLLDDPYLITPWIYYAAYFALAQVGRSRQAAKIYGYVRNLMDKHLVQSLDRPEVWERHMALLRSDLSDDEIEACKFVGYVYSQPEALAFLKQSID